MVTRHNFHRLDEIGGLVSEFGARLWSVFFLVATGHASASPDLTAEEYEEVFRILYRFSKTASFDIKTTEAQHYRRYVAQQRKAERVSGRPAPPPLEVIQRQSEINDGRGFVFHFAYGRDLSQWLLSSLSRQCPPEFASRRLQDLPTVSRPARSR